MKVREQLAAFKHISGKADKMKKRMKMRAIPVNTSFVSTYATGRELFRIRQGVGETKQSLKGRK